MIIIEFLVFVISSGLFCSERFRHHVWAVIVAGGIATGSSLLFVYDLGAKLTGHEKQPPVITKIVQRTVVKTEKISQPASAGKPHNCISYYPVESLNKGEQGTTLINFHILTDGTVDAIKVMASSGFDRLDEAAVKCASGWHYRPAIKDGQLVEATMTAKMKWVLPTDSTTKQLAAAKPADEIAPAQPVPAKETPAETHQAHPWYDVVSWFSSDSETPDPKADSTPDKKAP